MYGKYVIPLTKSDELKVIKNAKSSFINTVNFFKGYISNITRNVWPIECVIDKNSIIEDIVNHKCNYTL